MKTGKLNKSKKFYCALFVMFMLCSVSFLSEAQTARKFSRHDIVDVGNGQKAEIIQCRGEGPLEECDLIYYTTNRAAGVRTWENANRLRETERAAKLVRDLQEGKVNTLAKNRAATKKDTAEETDFIKNALVKVAVNSGQEASSVRGSRLLDSSGIGKDINRVVTLQKVIRQIDSATKARPDTFRQSLQRELEIQDSIANAGMKTEDEQAGPIHINADTTFSTGFATPAETKPVEINTPKPAIANANSLEAEKVKEVPIESRETSAVRPPSTAEKKSPVASSGTLKAIDEKPSTKERDTMTPGMHNNANLLNNDYITSAEVNINGSWQKASVIDKESEYLYKVHFEGKSAGEDEWVAISQIRNMDSVKKTTTVKEIKKGNSKSINCTFSAPAPPVSDADRFSEKLAKRKIYERHVQDAKQADASAKVGLTFQSFAVEKPFVNMVTVSAAGELVFTYSAAPAGAMIYPVNAQYTMCAQAASGQTTSKTVTGKYACFRNKEGIWTCTTR